MAKSHRARLSLPRSEMSPANNQGMDQGVTALSYLISGVLVWGLLGLLADHLLGTKVFIPIGIVLGAGLGCYMIIARFGGLGSTRGHGAGREIDGRGDEREKMSGEESTWAR